MGSCVRYDKVRYQLVSLANLRGANVNEDEIGPMLTTSEVAQLLNVHINTVRRWSNQGTLKAYRIGSRGDRRFKKEDVASFLKSFPGPAQSSFNA